MPMLRSGGRNRRASAGWRLPLPQNGHRGKAAPRKRRRRRRLRNAEKSRGGSFREAGMRWSAVLVMVGVSTVAFAQESALHAELRRESERVGDACQASFKAVPVCAYTLFTDHPLHIAAGSMPPQNGFGLGGAFVRFKNTKNWRLSWDVDAVGATSGAWRAGGYMKLVHTPEVVIKPIIPTSPGEGPSEKKPKKPSLAVHPYTVFNLYAQTISLNKLNFFGLGNNTTLAGESVFGMSET